MRRAANTIGAALLAACAAGALAGPTQAQGRGGSRDEQLDGLVRQLMVCSEIRDVGRRLSCYDAIQSAGAPAGPGPQIGVAPIAPPLQTPGGGSATLPAPRDVDRAFDPAAQRPPAGGVTGGGVRDERRRPGTPVGVNSRTPVVSIEVGQIRDFDFRWEMPVSATNNSQRTIDIEIACTFSNGSAPIAEVPFRPARVGPGETVSAQVVGPPTTTFLDRALCRVIGPLR